MPGMRNTSLLLGLPAAFLLVVGVSSPLQADAVVVTRAMLASTIAEIYVENNEVRTEIEIGPADLAAFVNLLPDDSYEALTGQSQPFAERIEQFFRSDWVVEADGQPLPGTLGLLDTARRVARDDVTGEPLPIQPNDAERVIRLTLHHRLEGQPQTLMIRPPQHDGVVAATIGFVCYHNGLPVNDFRYLTSEVSLDLDWDDPWYSRFRHRNLRRQYDAPLSVFLYIEPGEVRKEIVVRPKDLQEWIDLGLEGRETITVESQEKLKQRVAEFLSEHGTVFVDNLNVEGQLDRIHFIRRSLRTTGVVDPPQKLDLNAATLGVIYVFPIDKLPQEVSLRWDLFTPRIQEITAAATDETGSMPSRLVPEAPELRWENYLTNPTLPTMLEVASPQESRFTIPLVTSLCVVLLIAMIWIGYRSSQAGHGVPKVILVASVLVLALGILSLPYARASLPLPLASTAALEPAQAEDVLHALLFNVYRAFDHRDEQLVYDRLAMSISGDLLTDIYLQIRRGMELENQGGARVKVDAVEIQKINQAEEFPASELAFRCRWTASGSVGHWGHIHRRTNLYDALIRIEPIDEAWKITAIDLSDERRLDPTSTR